MANTRPSFLLRWNKEQRDKMKLIAEANNRSLHREIEQALKEHIAAYEAANGQLDVEFEPQQLDLFD